MDEKESNELMGNYILRPTYVPPLSREEENQVVGMALDISNVGLIPTPPLMLLKYN